MKSIASFISRLFPLLIFFIFLFQVGKSTQPKYEYDSSYNGRKGIPIVHAHYELNEDNIKMLEKSNSPEVIQALREKLRRQKGRSRLLKMQGLYNDDHDENKKTENKENEDEGKKVKIENVVKEKEKILTEDENKDNQKIKNIEKEKYIPASKVEDDIGDYLPGIFLLLLFIFGIFSLYWYYKKNKTQLVYKYDNLKKHKFGKLEHSI